MSDAEFWASTLREIYDLIAMRDLREQREDARAGISAALLSCLCGQRAEPGDFFPSLKQPRRVHTVEEIEAMVKAAHAAAAAKRPKGGV